MKTLYRLLGEPLVQFLVIGVVVFGVYSLVDRSPPETDRQVVEVGPGRIAQLFETFSRTWQRPPTQKELNGLIEAFVKEEIFYREGTKMGLERDDAVFRRRLQQKMEFLMEPSEADLAATDDELKNFLEANAETFHLPLQVAFRQVFLDPVKRGEDLQDDAAALLLQLSTNGDLAGATQFGDPTLMPHAMPATRLDRIDSGFGGQFAAELSNIRPGHWAGPIRSTFGLHLVFVEERNEARSPQLAEVRDLVLRDWQSAKRQSVAAARYAELRKNYEILVRLPETDGTTSSVTEKSQ